MECDWLERVVRETGCAQKHGETVFLCDPHWSAAQRARFKEIIEAEHRRQANEPAANKKSLRRHAAAAIEATGRESGCLRGWLAIPTGGSSGGLTFALHDEQTLGAAVRGFCAHFGVARVNAVDCLPPWHVSGLMARLRCAATGGVHVPWDWKRLQAGEFPDLPQRARERVGAASLAGDAEEVGDAEEAGGWFISLVPTQLQRLLKQGAAAVEWLRGFYAVFIGGGPVWPSLADEAVAAGLPIVLSYGMTETAAMVAAQRPGDFAAGDRSSGVPMPHAQISINSEGLVCVRGQSVALSTSYLASGSRSQSGAARQEANESKRERAFTTADLGRFDDGGRLHILGRRDEVAISGGEKVRLAEVEATLRGAVGSPAMFDDVAVIAVPDPEWGEAVVACYVAASGGGRSTRGDQCGGVGGRELSTAAIAHISSALARHQRPKQWLEFAPEEWPRNAQGKLNRAALREAALAKAQLRDGVSQ